MLPAGRHAATRQTCSTGCLGSAVSWLAAWALLLPETYSCFHEGSISPPANAGSHRADWRCRLF